MSPLYLCGEEGLVIAIMLSVLKQRKYRYILVANFVSLFGSGLNNAGIIWYVLQQTHSESALALLITLITLPSLLFLPFTGLLMDRVDRRRLAITLDLSRGLSVAFVAWLFWTGHGQLWHVYAMGVVLGIGGFIYWPTLSALIQELVEANEAIGVNALLMGAAQSGWMIAGTIVGFLYGRTGLAGILAIDAASYLVSATMYYRLRRGKNLDYRKKLAAEPVLPFAREMAAGVHYVMDHKPVLILATAAAIFQAAMMSQNVLTAPLNDKILHSGAFGYGMCAAGWSLGAILGSMAAGVAFRKQGRANQVIWMALAVMGSTALALPFSGILTIAMVLYFFMGSGRGFGGVGVGTALMHEVPKHVMGRTQNLISFVGILLQIVMTGAVGWLSDNVGLAKGFMVLGGGYLAASAFSYRIRHHQPAIAVAEEAVLVMREEV